MCTCACACACLCERLAYVFSALDNLRLFDVSESTGMYTRAPFVCRFLLCCCCPGWYVRGFIGAPRMRTNSKSARQSSRRGPEGERSKPLYTMPLRGYSEEVNS